MQNATTLTGLQGRHSPQATSEHQQPRNWGARWYLHHSTAQPRSRRVVHSFISTTRFAYHQQINLACVVTYVVRNTPRQTARAVHTEHPTSAGLLAEQEGDHQQSLAHIFSTRNLQLIKCNHGGSYSSFIFFTWIFHCHMQSSAHYKWWPSPC